MTQERYGPSASDTATIAARARTRELRNKRRCITAGLLTILLGAQGCSAPATNPITLSADTTCANFLKASDTSRDELVRRLAVDSGHEAILAPGYRENVDFNCSQSPSDTVQHIIDISGPQAAGSTPSITSPATESSASEEPSEATSDEPAGPTTVEPTSDDPANLGTWSTTTNVRDADGYTSTIDVDFSTLPSEISTETTPIGKTQVTPAFQASMTLTNTTPGKKNRIAYPHVAAYMRLPSRKYCSSWNDDESIPVTIKGSGNWYYCLAWSISVGVFYGDFAPDASKTIHFDGSRGSGHVGAQVADEKATAVGDLFDSAPITWVLWFYTDETFLNKKATTLRGADGSSYIVQILAKSGPLH